MPKKIVNMSDEELMDAWTQAGGDLEEAKKKVKAFSTEFHTRENQRQLAQKLGQDYDLMNNPQKAALAQFAEAIGIESEEKVGAES